MLFCVDDDLVSEVTTDEVDDVPEPCTGMPVGYTSSIADIGVVEGNEGVKNDFPPWKSGEDPYQWHDVGTREGGENN